MCISVSRLNPSTTGDTLDTEEHRDYYSASFWTFQMLMKIERWKRWRKVPHCLYPGRGNLPTMPPCTHIICHLPPLKHTQTHSTKAECLTQQTAGQSCYRSFVPFVSRCCLLCWIRTTEDHEHLILTALFRQYQSMPSDDMC